MEIRVRKQRAITLISLVITIIILLILAGVTIATLTGENGILNQANQAKQNTKSASEIEQIALAVTNAQLEDNTYVKLNQKNLQNAIDNQLGENKAIVIENEGGTFTVFLKENKKAYQILSTGIEEDPKWNQAFEQAIAQEVNGKIVYAVDQEGNNVNMTNWEFCYDQQTQGYALNDDEVLNNAEYGGTNPSRVRTKGYLGSYTNDGEVIEQVPMFIKEGEDWQPVTSMYNTFYDCAELKKSPPIPPTVTCMWSTYQACSHLTETTVGKGAQNLWNCFLECTSLVNTPVLPSTVENLMQTFYGCTSLTDVSYLPEGIINMNGTFRGCTSLSHVPDIPNTVTIMDNTFYKCSNFLIAPKIGKSVKKMNGTFYQCTQLEEAPAIPDGVEIMRSTFNGCTNLSKPPTKIPTSVVNLIGTFQYCTHLEGTIEINASVTNEVAQTSDYDWIIGSKVYEDIFKGACRVGQGLTVKTNNAELKMNHAEILNDIINMKSSDSNLTIIE